MKKYLEITHNETGKVVKRIDVSISSERTIEKCAMGILMNMNIDEYHVHLNETEETLTLIG
jgi:phosphoribosylformylglycinamidine (FGAM) synthase PurS component